MRINNVMPMNINKPSFGLLTDYDRNMLDDIYKKSSEVYVQNAQLKWQNKKLSEQNVAIIRAILNMAEVMPGLTPFRLESIRDEASTVKSLDKNF